MSNKHTPGPWAVESWTNGIVEGTEIKAGDDTIADIYGRLEDARLMAAAPDLLEAAQSLLITWRCSLTDAENDAPTIDQFCEYSQILALEAAIKKAKGEE